MQSANELHTLFTTMTYLMTRYSLQRGTDNLSCASLAAAEGIKQHLEHLLTHPDIQASPTARSAYHSLLCEWCGIVSQHQQALHSPSVCHYSETCTPSACSDGHAMH